MLRRGRIAERSGDQPSKAASTSSGMSALECTAWTSSWSSIASRRRRTFLASASSGTGTEGGRLEGEVDGLGRDAGVVEGLAHRLEVGGRAGDDPGRAVARHVLGAALHGDLHDLVLVLVEGDGHDALALELPADGAGLGHVAAVAAEEVAHLGAGAVAVVAERLDHDGHAAGAVALVVDGLVAHALEVARPPLDGLLDGVERHRGALRLLVGGAQGGVGVEVAPALPGRHLDGPDALGEDLGAGLVLGALAVLGGRPLRVTRHGCDSTGRGQGRTMGSPTSSSTTSW